MFDQYFTYWTELPADGGYAMYGAFHIAWLCCIVLGIVCICIWFRKRTFRTQTWVLRFFGILLLCLEAYREIVLGVTGHLIFSNLPLHLCGLAIFLEALYVWWPCTFLGEMTCVICLPGAASALLFPDWLRYPAVNYMMIHGFLLHGILVLLPILVLASGRYRPKIKNIWMPLLFFAVSAPVLYVLNTRYQANFMFLNAPSEGSPFELVYERFGYPGYMAVFGGTVLVLIFIMYAWESPLAKHIISRNQQVPS